MNKFSENRKVRAMSLAELIIGLCLFAIAIIPVFGIIPTAYMSIKKAEDYSTASFYAQQVAEIYRLSDPTFDDYKFHNEWDKELNNQTYHVVLDLEGKDLLPSGTPGTPHSLVDVLVRIYWMDYRDNLTLYTRINYNYNY